MTLIICKTIKWLTLCTARHEKNKWLLLKDQKNLKHSFILFWNQCSVARVRENAQIVSCKCESEKYLNPRTNQHGREKLWITSCPIQGLCIWFDWSDLSLKLPLSGLWFRTKTNNEWMEDQTLFSSCTTQTKTTEHMAGSKCFNALN